MVDTPDPSASELPASLMTGPGLTGPGRSQEPGPADPFYRRLIPFGGAVMINLALVMVLGVAVKVSFVVPIREGEFLIPVDILNAEQVFPDEVRERGEPTPEERAEEQPPDAETPDAETPEPEAPDTEIAEPETPEPETPEPETPDTETPEDDAQSDEPTEAERTGDALSVPPEDPALQDTEARNGGDEGEDAATKSAQEAALEGPDNQSDRAPDNPLTEQPRSRTELDDLFEQIYGRRPSDAPLPAVEAAKEQKKEDPYAGLTGPEIDALFRQRNLPSVDLPAQLRAGAQGESIAGIIAIYCNRVFSDNADKAAECAGRPEILSGWVDDGTYQALIRRNLRQSGVDPARYGPSGGGRRAVAQRARAATAQADEAVITRDGLGAFEQEASRAAAKAAEPGDRDAITNFGGKARKGANTANDDPFGFGASPIPQKKYEPGWAVRTSPEQVEIERLIEEDRGE